MEGGLADRGMIPISSGGTFTMPVRTMRLPPRVGAIAVSLALILTAFFAVAASPVAAATDCTFTTSGTTMRLNADCTTDSSILIPNGFTLDGRGHTITGIDPPGGHFVGAVVRNGGATANVRNLGVTVSGLADVCDAGDDRLRGIMFDGASGRIERTVVSNLNQGTSGCQEGNAIEVRNAPFDGTHPATVVVRVENNEVTGYQKTGILANGDVSVRVGSNTITGFGPVDFIAQNGIQLGFGALGDVRENEVSANEYTPQTFAGSGILLFDVSAGVLVQNNRVATSDVGIWVSDMHDGVVKNNRVDGSTFDGIALDTGSSGNTIEKNRLTGNDVGIGLYEEAVTGNLIRSNKANGNATNGILTDGATGNTITKNTAKSNGVLDIDNTGANTYTQNKCKTSSGPPVDCP
jgi:parallel beta-helix repeat protein